LEGRPGTFHACEIAFVFDNAGFCLRQTGGGPAALVRKVSQAATWLAYEAMKHPTMFFDDPCFTRNNPESEGLRLIRQAS
jgi:para-nitrobenzyl esterase